MNSQQFLTILQNLTSANNQLRQSAEISFNTFKANALPDLLYIFLDSLLLDDIPHDLKLLICILLRRSIVEDFQETFRILSLDQKQLFTRKLMATIELEKNPSIKCKLCESCGELGGILMDDNGIDSWPELVHYTAQKCQSTSPDDREIGLTLLRPLAGYLAASSSSDQQNDNAPLRQLVGICNTCLLDTSVNGKISILALSVAGSVIGAISSETEGSELFNPLILTIFRAFSNLYSIFVLDCQSVSEAKLCVFLEILVEIAEEKPMLFCGSIGTLFPAIVDLLKNSNGDGAGGINPPVSVKQLLLEFLVELSESCPKVIRKLKGSRGNNLFIAGLVPICLSWMTEEPDLVGWETATTAEEDDDYDVGETGSLAAVGGDALSRLCLALGVRSCYKVISAEISPYLSSNVWKYQLAGLRCIASFLEISTGISDSKLLDLHRKEVVETLRFFSKNSNPRVRAATFIAISQFFLYHRNSLDASLHIDPLLQISAEGSTLSGNSSPRVRRQALLALTNIINSSSYEYLELRAVKVLHLLAQCIGEGPQLIQEESLSAITSMVESLRGSSIWCTYYSEIIPLLKQVLNNLRGVGGQLPVADGDGDRDGNFWLKVLECCAVIGDAAGRDHFVTDCADIMRLLIDFQQSIRDQAAYRAKLGGEAAEEEEEEDSIPVLKIWVQIARCLGTEVVPYLHPVIVSLLRLLGKDVTVPVDKLQELDGNENESDEDDDDDDIQMLETANGEWIAVRTSTVEEQSAACKLTLLLMEALQEHMYVFAEQLHHEVSRLISSPHEDVRSYAIVLVPELIRCIGKAAACSQLDANDLQVYRYEKIQHYLPLCLQLLINSASEESTLVLIMTGLQSLKQTVKYACTNWLSIVVADRDSLATNPSSPMKSKFETAPPTLSSSVRLLTHQQMLDISQCAKIVLRDSFQRRAVLRAEANVSGQRDDDDVDDERAFMEESLELHTNVAELIGTMFRTHGLEFFPVYMDIWHEVIHNACQPFCLKEDQQFAFYVISDAIEFGLGGGGGGGGAGSEENARQYFALVMDTMINACGGSLSESHESHEINLELKKICAYSIGKAAELYPAAFEPYVNAALKGLWVCVTAGDQDGPGSRGDSTDNAVAAVGIILEAAETNRNQFCNEASNSFHYIWGEWLSYLPIKDDLEEGEKAISQLVRLVGKNHPAVVGKRDRLIMTMSVLLMVMDADEYLPGGKQSHISVGCRDCLKQLLCTMSADLFSTAQETDRVRSAFNSTSSPMTVKSLSQWLSPDLCGKLNILLQELQSESAKSFRSPDSFLHGGIFDGSPLATAPILDVLMRKS